MTVADIFWLLNFDHFAVLVVKIFLSDDALWFSGSET